MILEDLEDSERPVMILEDLENSERPAMILEDLEMFFWIQLRRFI